MRIRRWTTAALVALMAVPAVATMAALAGAAAAGPYSGSATGDLVHVNAVNSPAILPGVADVHLARSTADVEFRRAGRSRRQEFGGARHQPRRAAARGLG